jgi:LAS superfamily LD-carboxypeptidase LdcB
LRPLLFKPIKKIMKKWMISSLILIALMVVAAGVYAQTSDKEKKQTKKECTFVDANKDGKCDTCGTTADACKKDAAAAKECGTAATKDCAKCPAAAGCAETKGDVVPTTAPVKK